MIALQVLRSVAQYTKLASMVQRVCDYPVQIIALQVEIMNLKVQIIFLPKCDHTELENRVRTLINECDKESQRSAALGTNEVL